MAGRKRGGEGGIICSDQLNHIPQNCTGHIIMVVWVTVFIIIKLMLRTFDVEVMG